jgi:glycosyltransferase involved in cell wall biosynthesis
MANKLDKSLLVVIVPSFNEAENINKEISELRKHGLLNVIVSIDPNNSDTTELTLQSLKVRYIIAKRSGYDHAMQAGVEAISRYCPNAKSVLFSDMGNKNRYEYVDPFINELDKGADMVLGTRRAKTKSMLWHQKTGTRFVLILINYWFRSKIKDISPFRLIRYDVLLSLKMQPSRFRWTTEMLVKCLSLNKTIKEISVNTNRRAGKSKISGNLKNTLIAAYDMLSALKFVYYDN